MVNPGIGNNFLFVSEQPVQTRNEGDRAGSKPASPLDSTTRKELRKCTEYSWNRQIFFLFLYLIEFILCRELCLVKWVV